MMIYDTAKILRGETLTSSLKTDSGRLVKNHYIKCFGSCALATSVCDVVLWNLLTVWNS